MSKHSSAECLPSYVVVEKPVGGEKSGFILCVFSTGSGICMVGCPEGEGGEMYILVPQIIN